MRFELAGVLVYGNDWNNDAVFRKMPAVANHHLFNFFERPRINEYASCGDLVTAISSIFGEFNTVAVFGKNNFAGHHTKLMRERRMTEKVPILAVNRNEILRLDELQKKFLFFLTSM